MRLDKYLKLDNIMMDFVWLLPKWVVYWCGIRLFSHATTDKYGSTIASELTMFDALERWHKDYKVDV